MDIHPSVERFPRLAHVLETTPPTFYQTNHIHSFAGGMLSDGELLCCDYLHIVLMKEIIAEMLMM